MIGAAVFALARAESAAVFAGRRTLPARNYPRRNRPGLGNSGLERGRGGYHVLPLLYIPINLSCVWPCKSGCTRLVARKATET